MKVSRFSRRDGRLVSIHKNRFQIAVIMLIKPDLNKQIFFSFEKKLSQILPLPPIPAPLNSQLCICQSFQHCRRTFSLMCISDQDALDNICDNQSCTEHLLISTLDIMMDSLFPFSFFSLKLIQYPKNMCCLTHPHTMNGSKYS